MSQSRTSDANEYRELFDAPTDYLLYYLSRRIDRLQHILHTLQAIEPKRSTRRLAVEMTVLLLFTLGLLTFALLPLFSGAASFDFGDDDAGFPSSVAALGLLIIPFALYALYSVYFSYVRIQRRRQEVESFIASATQLLEDARHLAKEAETEMR